jgi:hypothetical protein
MTTGTVRRFIASPYPGVLLFPWGNLPGLHLQEPYSHLLLLLLFLPFLVFAFVVFAFIPYWGLFPMKSDSEPPGSVGHKVEVSYLPRRHLSLDVVAVKVEFAGLVSLYLQRNRVSLFYLDSFGAKPLLLDLDWNLNLLGSVAATGGCEERYGTVSANSAMNDLTDFIVSSLKENSGVGCQRFLDSFGPMSEVGPVLQTGIEVNQESLPFCYRQPVPVGLAEAMDMIPHLCLGRLSSPAPSVDMTPVWCHPCF